MTEPIDSSPQGAPLPEVDKGLRTVPAWQHAMGWVGVAMALPFFVWAPLAMIAPVPSMIDVFGVVGLRIPASITVGGLLLAAIGFHEF